MFSIFNIAIFFYAAVMTQIKILLFYFSVNFSKSKSNGIFFMFSCRKRTFSFCGHDSKHSTVYYKKDVGNKACWFLLDKRLQIHQYHHVS